MKKIISINLGNWFVLERWMKPSLFEKNGVVGKDETAFSIQVENLEEVLDEHYKTWITVEDIRWIKEAGFNLVRVPIPWWLFGEGIYNRSVEYIDEAFKMIASEGMDFMIDLHTAPGCQNGFDNGGIEGVIDWHKDERNIEKTIQILEVIARRYKDFDHFHSIQLLNEPHFLTDLHIIREFYKSAYYRLRKIIPEKIIVMHDAFRIYEWEEFFVTNNFTNVILDTHMYQCFGKHSLHYDEDAHIKSALNRKVVLKEIEKFVPVIVGEWSLGLGFNEHINTSNINRVEKAYAKAQLEGMREGTGHTFWSYKIETHESGWNFRGLVERGIIDLKEL